MASRDGLSNTLEETYLGVFIATNILYMECQLQVCSALHTHCPSLHGMRCQVQGQTGLVNADLPEAPTDQEGEKEQEREKTHQRGFAVT